MPTHNGGKAWQHRWAGKAAQGQHATVRLGEGPALWLRRNANFRNAAAALDVHALPGPFPRCCVPLVAAGCQWCQQARQYAAHRGEGDEACSCPSLLYACRPLRPHTDVRPHTSACVELHWRRWVRGASRQEGAGGRRQAAGGRRQAAGGRREQERERERGGRSRSCMQHAPGVCHRPRLSI